METLYKYIQEINEASKCGQLVFFVGAGISRLSEYPQWWELVNKYYIELYGGPKEEYSFNDFLRIPQIFYDVKKEDKFDRILEDVFSVEKAINPIHDKILAMNPTHIITTNYDNLIDKACWQRGRYYSIISNDEDVAKATSSRYLLKVHGDFRRGFKGKHIVLKESDYMDYERNYPLISNLMKTIVATCTIVFIGYGLGDYNINLILNWVKQLQQDSYKKPFFIRADHEPIDEYTKVYYEKRGLRIIDTTSLQCTAKDDYLRRYNAAMDALTDMKDNSHLSKSSEVINYIYQKISPLFLLGSIRKIDLKYVFGFDYMFEVNGYVVKNQNKGYGYLEHFFSLKGDDIGGLSEESKNQLNEISTFFKRNNIICMLNDLDRRESQNPFILENPAYHNDYDKMDEYIKMASSSIEEEYRKAFYLGCLGRWEESYKLYSEIISKSIDESNWWIHYLSQINRYRMYQSITQKVNYLNNTGFFVYRSVFKPFSDDFLECIEREMKQFDIDDVFAGMPYEFQEKYKILEFLSDNEFLYNDTVKLFELTNKVRSEMSKGTYSLGGMTPDYEVQLRLNDNIRFLYDNNLWLVHFSEFKQYVRNSLILQFEKAEFEQTRDIDDLGLFAGINRDDFFVDYYDFVNITKSFTIDDIRYIEKRCKIEKFKFHDMQDIEKYIVRIANEIIKHFSKDGMKEIFYNQIIPEAKVAFYFARYIKLSEEALITILRAILIYYPELDADIRTRYSWVERLLVNNVLTESSIRVIEEVLIKQFLMHKGNDGQEVSANSQYYGEFGYLIHHFYKDYVSGDLSRYAILLSEAQKLEIDYMYRLSPILSDEAKKHLHEIKKIEGVDDLIYSYHKGVMDNISDYKDIIIAFMDNKKSQLLTNREESFSIRTDDSHYVIFGVWYFLGKFKDPIMRNYMGIIDEYDFFVDPGTFDYTKFCPAWLKNYSDGLIDKIAENNYMRTHLIEILKERIKNAKDNNYIEILIDHFL